MVVVRDRSVERSNGLLRMRIIERGYIELISSLSKHKITFITRGHSAWTNILREMANSHIYVIYDSMDLREGIGRETDLHRRAREVIVTNRRFLANFERGIRKLMVIYDWYTRNTNRTSNAWRREVFCQVRHFRIRDRRVRPTFLRIFQT